MEENKPWSTLELAKDYLTNKRKREEVITLAKNISASPRRVDEYGRTVSTLYQRVLTYDNSPLVNDVNGRVYVSMGTSDKIPMQVSFPTVEQFYAYVLAKFW